MTSRRPGPAAKQLLRAKRALAEARRAFAVLVRAVRSLEKTASRATATRGRPNLSPKRRAALRLQGRYMGYMRQLKPVQKKRVKAVKARKGIRAAIGVAQSLAAGR